MSASKVAAPADIRQGRLRATFDQASIGIAHVGTDGRFLSANPELQRLTGYSEEELRSMTFADITHPDDVDENRTQACRLASGEIPVFRAAKRYVRKDGAVVWARVSSCPAREEPSGERFFLTFVEDVDDTQWKAAEEALKLADRQLRAVLTATEVGLWYWDPRRDQLFGDRNLMRLFGLTAREEVTPIAPYLERIHPTDRPRVRAAIERALATGGHYDEVYRVEQPDGGVRWLHARGLVDLGPDGKPLSFPGIAVDVTRTFDATERLRESDERYQALLRSVNDGFSVIDLIFDEAGRAVDYRFIEVNASFAKQTGLEGAAGKTAREVVPDLSAFWFESYGRVALTGETVRFERHEPAMRRTFEVEAMRVGAPERRRVAVLFRDITARREAEAAQRGAEAALRESEERFRALADNIAQLAWMADETGHRFWYNRRWFEFTGTTLEEMRGQGWRSVHHPDHAQRVFAKLDACIASGEPWEDTFPLRGKDGTYRWFLSRAIPIRDGAGRVVRWFGTNTDITEQRAAEAALLSLNEKLLEADRRKDEFIGILAHELRNPLAPVCNSVEILQRVGLADPRVERARSVIERQVAHMARLIDDLLDVSRIARGKLALRKQTCDLTAIARQTAEDYRESLENAGLRLSLSGAEGPVWVEGDPVRLAQMIANLLHNSSRFTDAGGLVEVRADVDEAAGCAVVSVRDTGEGIDPELLSRLFDPFSQAGQDLARSKGGLGLGLALTKGLAELHGGEVEAWSAGRGHGATFTLRIPWNRARDTNLSRNRAPCAEGAGLRVLVVEDNRDAAETLGELLELGGYEVRLAFDGAEAVAAAHELRPDAVISDIGLPGDLDGYSVARALRADPSFEGVYLIALSGYANDDARRRSREAGFDAHLAKPADITTLERMLSEGPRRATS